MASLSQKKTSVRSDLLRDHPPRRQRASRFLVPLPERLGPTGPGLLTGATDRKRAALDRFRDYRARADIGAIPDRHRGHKRRIRTDERAGPNVRFVLGEAVVIAGDGSGADVRLGADTRIANVGQMVDLGALLDCRLLDLDEIADSCVWPDVRAWPQARVGPDDRSARDPRPFEIRKGVDHRTVLDGAPGPDYDMRFDKDVAADRGVKGQEHRSRGCQRRARGHCSPA